MARRHGNEVLALLTAIDDAEKLAREEVKQRKSDTRRQMTEARQAERKKDQKQEREERRVQKARDKAKRDKQKEEERVTKRLQQDAERVAIQHQREAAKPRQPPRPALTGSSVFNVTPLTPVQPSQVCFIIAHRGII